MADILWALRQYPRPLFFFIGMFVGAGLYYVAQVVTLAAIAYLKG